MVTWCFSKSDSMFHQALRDDTVHYNALCIFTAIWFPGQYLATVHVHFLFSTCTLDQSRFWFSYLCENSNFTIFNYMPAGIEHYAPELVHGTEHYRLHYDSMFFQIYHFLSKNEYNFSLWLPSHLKTLIFCAMMPTFLSIFITDSIIFSNLLVQQLPAYSRIYRKQNVKSFQVGKISALAY